MSDDSDLPETASEDNKRAERRERLKSAMGDAGTDKRQGRRKIVMRLHQMLSSTPDDGTGLVKGTEFSLAGVDRLIAVLKERSADENKTGAKAASRMLDFLTPDGEESEVINGVSVAKLQWIAKMGERLRN